MSAHWNAAVGIAKEKAKDKLKENPEHMKHIDALHKHVLSSLEDAIQTRRQTHAAAKHARAKAKAKANNRMMEYGRCTGGACGHAEHLLKAVGARAPDSTWAPTPTGERQQHSLNGGDDNPNASVAATVSAAPPKRRLGVVAGQNILDRICISDSASELTSVSEEQQESFRGGHANPQAAAAPLDFHEANASALTPTSAKQQHSLIGGYANPHAAQTPPKSRVDVVAAQEMLNNLSRHEAPALAPPRGANPQAVPVESTDSTQVSAHQPLSAARAAPTQPMIRAECQPPPSECVIVSATQAVAGPRCSLATSRSQCRRRSRPPCPPVSAKAPLGWNAKQDLDMNRNRVVRRTRVPNISLVQDISMTPMCHGWHQASRPTKPRLILNSPSRQ